MKLPVLLTIAITSLLIQNAASQALNSAQMLRFACSQLVIDRVDPIVAPGETYVGHLHQIVGGNSFDLTMDPNTYDPATLSTCTSCSFVEDLSNYWTAVMFFKARNGTYRRVPQIGNGGPQGKLVNKGGMDIYYIPNGQATAFKKGFRMIAGTAGNNDPNQVSKANICHRCWTATSEDTFVGGAPCSGSDSVEIPTNGCNFVRQTIMFPTCWDGKNLDSPDHKSHVAYGTGLTLTCPSTHPVKLPQLMFEIMWDFTPFKDKSIWPADGSNPFVYSMGLSGPAAHGDYIFGWKEGTLQKAMDNKCDLNRDCPAAGLHYQAPEKYNACTLQPKSPEKIDGWIPALPLGRMVMSPTPSPTVSCAANSPKQPSLAQCGGKVYNGPTCCESGNVCVKVSDWYSQCKPQN